MKKVVKKFFELAGRQFFKMRKGEHCRVYEIQSSDKKLSAQLVEIKPPERDHIMNICEK